MRWLAFSPLLSGAAAADTTQWTGGYLCAQGPTGMKLTVIDDEPARVTAILAFGPTPANPDLPRGSFALAGSRQGGRLELRPVDWLQRPEDYEMVGLRGHIRGDRLEGAILHETCGAFSLRRVGATPPTSR